MSIETNSGFQFDQTESRVDDWIVTPPALGVDEPEEVLVAELPTGPTNSHDKHTPPGCAFCNHEEHVKDRLANMLRQHLQSGKGLMDIPFERREAIVRADYALVDLGKCGERTATVVAFSCHACVADAEDVV